MNRNWDLTTIEKRRDLRGNEIYTVDYDELFKKIYLGNNKVYEPFVEQAKNLALLNGIDYFDVDGQIKIELNIARLICLASDNYDNYGRFYSYLIARKSLSLRQTA